MIERSLMGDNSELPDSLDDGDNNPDWAAPETETQNADAPPQLPTPTIDITVSEDRLYAYLTIEQQPPEPYQITVDEIYDVLAAAKVEAGVLLEKIDQIVTNRQYPTNELIATGQAMVPGIDATLEYLFDASIGGRPKDLGHYVDHHNLNLVHNVSAGQVLVRKTEPVAGQVGLSVYGQPLKPNKAKDVRLPAGKGTQISETNPLELVAKIDGFVRLDRHSFKRVVVEDVFEVRGDVHLSTGNLDIDGSVRVLGNVREGFSVKASGNITIGGAVEAATLDAGGSILISGGIIGGKRGAHISAVDSIIVKFADNASMTAGHTITVADEAVNCQLQADRAILVGGESKMAGAIIGGLVSAGQEIRAKNVGSDAGILTQLRVGHQPQLLERQRHMQADINKARNQIDNLEQTIASLKERQEERAPLREQRLQNINSLKQRQTAYYQKIRYLLAEAERNGVVTSAAMIESLENQINETRNTLQRVDDSIATLRQRINEKSSIANTLNSKKTLEQFQSAHTNLINKLTDLEAQLAQRLANRSAALPWNIRQELEQNQEALTSIQATLATLEAEDIADQKIDDALQQVCADYDRSRIELAALNSELQVIKQKTDDANSINPQIIVFEHLWSGTEVTIRQRRRRFTKDRASVKLQLSEKEAVIVRSLS
jgi:uncharacterized protein (DUF342 family)